MWSRENKPLVLLEAQYPNDREMGYKMFFKNYMGGKRKKIA